MLITVLDGAGVSQKVIVKGQEAVINRSGTIAATGVAQVLMAANTLRSGWFLQNLSGNVMYVNDGGSATVGAGSFAVAPGTTFPPANFPVVTGAISIIGTSADTFSAREW